MTAGFTTLARGAATWFAVVAWSALSCAAMAEDDGLVRLASPYGGSLSAEEQRASAAVRPSFADANWNHEVCVAAYSYENTAREIATARAAFEEQAAEISAQARAEGIPESEIRESIEHARADLEGRIQASEQVAARHLANIPKCGGQFFRPALESACLDEADGNRFCAQLNGPLLPGVELSEDELEFAHGLSWNKVGHLFTQGTTFVPAPWSAAPARPLQSSGYSMTRADDGIYYFDTPGGGRRVNSAYSDNDLPDYMARAKEADLEAASRTGIPFVTTVNDAAIGDGDQRMPNGFGEWSFSIGVERFAKFQVGHEVSVLAGNIERETGMITDLGEYYQLPEIHFQAQMYDILVQSDFARFSIEKADGETVVLHGTAPDFDGIARFQSAPSDGPFFGSSYSSYRIHALMTPSPDDLSAILAPDAAYLIASFELLLEDGSIDVVSLRTPLVGLSDAWARMNQNHGETRDLIRRTAAGWDQDIAVMEAGVAETARQRGAARQAAAALTEKEARDYIAANPFARPCDRLPAVGNVRDADSLNRTARRALECDRRWVTHALAVKEELGSLRYRYASAGGDEDFIADEIRRWDDGLAARNAELAQYNAAIQAHNRSVQQNAAQNPSRQPSSAVARRRQSADRRRRQRQDEGRDYAREFYENATRPQQSIFRDVTIPPKPTGYMGTGYW